MQVALGPGTLVTLVVTTSCTPKVRWISQSRCSTRSISATLWGCSCSLRDERCQGATGYKNSWCDSRTQGLRQTVSQYRLVGSEYLWVIDNGKQQSNTLFNSICNLQYMFNINTRLVTNEDTQNGPHESWQVETPSRVGKSRCYSCFLVLLSCIGEWLHDARCFHLEGCHQRGKLLLCAPDMLHPFELGSGLIYRDLPWLTDCSLESGARLKCSPGPIYQPIHLTLQTPSRSNGLIGEEKRLLQAPIVPKCKPMKSQIKGRSHTSYLKHRD